MNVIYDLAFFKKLKKIDVRIRKSVKEKILLFSQNPSEPHLNNHALKRDWEGFRSIDITADWRAIYKEIKDSNDNLSAYFVAFGTHSELYK